MNKSHVLDVIRYTIAQEYKKKSILITTIIFSLILICALPITAYVLLDKENKEKSTIDRVIVYDNTDFKDVGYDSICNSDKMFKDVKVKVYNDVSDKKIKKEIKKNRNKRCVIVHLEHSKQINVEMIIPTDSKVKQAHASKIGEYISGLLSLKKYEIAANDEVQLLELMARTTVEKHILGKGKDDGIATMVRYSLPFIYVMIIYFMLLTYGQSIANSMVTEKNSKIIELLVSCIKPRQLIIGKVLGNLIVSLSQIAVWAVSLIAGVICANRVSIHLDNKKFIDIAKIIESVRISNKNDAFSIRAILIFVVLLLMGFLLYYVYAAICGAFINKPDEASSVLAIYTYTIVIVFMLSYVVMFTENDTLKEVINYIPFSMTFITPINVLIGDTSMATGLICIGIMMLSCIIIIWILGQVYERLVFNTLSIKELIKGSKNNIVTEGKRNE